MLGKNTLLAVGAVCAGLLLPAQAMAQYEAYTRVDLNLRVGPAMDYGVIDVIPYDDPVNVLGCLDGINWCDVEWYGLRGWVAASYLVQPGTSVYLPQVYTTIGLPIISFSFNTYHDRHYRDRPWYRERRGRWRGEDYRRGDRPRQRQEAERPRQRDRSEERQQTQEREERQEQRQQTEQRQEQRQERQEQRQRTEQRQQQRQEAEQPRQRQQTEQRQQRQQQRQQQPQQAEQPRQRQEAEQPRQGQRAQQQRQQPQGQGRARGGGQPQEEIRRQ